MHQAIRNTVVCPPRIQAMPKEAQARIKINHLLEAAGWRFFDSQAGTANIALEPKVKLTQTQVDAFGNDFETSSNGYIDFLLLDEQRFPLVVLEAKAETKNPRIGKEQARKYAKSRNCRFVILSNGNLHYFWDLQHGNPHVITTFPAPHAIKGYAKFQPDPTRPSLPCSRTTTRVLSTRKAVTTGAMQRSSLPPCKACFSTPNTSSFHPPTLTW
jgi:type I site-specific restriction endonuclease